MVELYSGTPGSGKSLHTAHEIREKLRWGRKVISTCNIDTSYCFMNKLQTLLFRVTKGKVHLYNEDERSKNFTYIPNEYITPEFLFEFAAKNHKFGKEHQTLLVIDECVQLFSPTVIGDNIKVWNAWEDFFRKHRHLGFDVILIPQHVKAISRKVIYYCEFDVRHYNRRHYGTFGFFLSLILGGLFSYSVFWRGTKEKPLSQKFFTYNRLYGSMYNSYSMFDETLRPYKEKYEAEQKRELIAKMCGILEERRIALEKGI